MIYHHMLDILRGRISPPGVMVSPKLDRRATARLMRDAEIFDFGDLALEETGQHSEIDGSPIWKVPELTQEELSFWNDGLIPMPAERIWINFLLNGSESGLLIVGSAPDVQIMRMDHDPARGTGVVVGSWIQPQGDGSVNIDYTQAFPSIAKFYGRYPVEAAAEASAIMLVRWLLLMLNSRSTERERVVVTADPARRAANRHQLPDHTVVRIIPREVLTELRRNADGRSHASPRLHWRRSHLREYKAPSGETYHRVVIPRALVGLASKGTVTHTYKVKL